MNSARTVRKEHTRKWLLEVKWKEEKCLLIQKIKLEVSMCLYKTSFRCVEEGRRLLICEGAC